MKLKSFSLILCFVLIATFTLSACGEKKEEYQIGSNYKAYVDSVDPEYAFNLAKEIGESGDYDSNSMGDRLAGSKAEHKAADRFVEEMKTIGLTNVKKEPVTVRTFEPKDSQIQIDGIEGDIKIHPYQSGEGTNGDVKTDIVYVGKGTKADFEGKDVNGKVVLIDVNQRADWWYTYPVMEAELHGAVACLIAQWGGFSEVSDDAYNENDFCGPMSLPSASITNTDANKIKELLGVKAGYDEKAETFVVTKYGKTKSCTVNIGCTMKMGKTYNIVGMIKGASDAEAIGYSAHYDAYYKGFQDDTIAASSVLGIAKAYIDSGYKSNRDIYFILHGAEEWGNSDTQYDWQVGSYEMIHKVNPDWQGKLLALFNFELNAYQFADYMYTYSPYEMFTMIDGFTNDKDQPIPDPSKLYKDGILTEGFRTFTYSDDFSYYINGVPAMANGFFEAQKSGEGIKGTEKAGEGQEVFDFYYDYYHTNFDTSETYNEDALKYNMDYYGAMGIYVDKKPALEIDYKGQVDRLTEALDDDFAKKSGITEAQVENYRAVVAEYGSTSELLKAKIDLINTEYKDLVDKESDQALIDQKFKEGQELNKVNLKVFKKTQDLLLALMYEKPIVPHEGPANNLKVLNDVIALLEKGDVVGAVDGTKTANYEDGIWGINNVQGWYTKFFSKEVVDEIRASLDGTNGANMYWGTGRMFPYAEVDDVIISLVSKYDAKKPDVSSELATLKQVKTTMEDSFAELLTKDIKSIKTLTKRIQKIVN